MKVLTALKPFVPPALIPLVRKIQHQFSGDYPSWEAALDAVGGYDAPAILERVRAAALKVKRGEAVFERDSVCFDHEEYRWTTLACLLRVAAENDGKLRVLDFGGSLGSFYFQHRRHFRCLKQLRWAVVEQPHYVTCGREEFQDDVLRFYETMEECLSKGKIDVILCSSVLQYLEKPYAMLAEFGQSGVQYIMLDRTPFIAAENDRLTVQYVPEFICPASYPAWFFSYKRFLEAVNHVGFRVEVEFPGEDEVGIGNFMGILLARS